MRPGREINGGSPGGAFLPRPPASVFLVGLGGVGMSALAQLLAARGYRVSGSDRQLDGPGRAELMSRLRDLGICVYRQDGSGVRAAHPDLVVASSAVEGDNADLLAARGCLLMGRAQALAQLLERSPGRLIAVGGSCGKTTVTAWLAAALIALGRRVLAVCGGTMIAAEEAGRIGTVWDCPDPEWIVCEVDESDRSLVAFRPYCGVVLNVGRDHYPRNELIEVFARFLEGCRGTAVLPLELAAELGPRAPRRIAWFAGHPEACVPDADGPEAGDRSVMAVTGYRRGARGMAFACNNGPWFETRQFGRHSATNGAAVLAALAAIGETPSVEALQQALLAFPGVRQRFEFVGTTPEGTPVYLDYAHNAEKIRAALLALKDAADGPVAALFQPHGYGPLGFMREALAEVLEEVLEETDLFLFLPVYYAGGTTSFEPTSAAVAAGLAERGLPVLSVPDAAAALARIEGRREGACAGIVLLGARDPSLPSVARGLVSNG